MHLHTHHCFNLLVHLWDRMGECACADVSCNLIDTAVIISTAHINIRPIENALLWPNSHTECIRYFNEKFIGFLDIGHRKKKKHKQLHQSKQTHTHTRRSYSVNNRIDTVAITMQLSIFYGLAKVLHTFVKLFEYIMFTIPVDWITVRYFCAVSWTRWQVVNLSGWNIIIHYDRADFRFPIRDLCNAQWMILILTFQNDR